jgi:hypothetical protein
MKVVSKKVTENRPWKTGHTANTVLYRFGDKRITALAAMKLVDQGKLDMDNPFRPTFPGSRRLTRTQQRRLTVRHLLNHTSG